MILHYLVHRKIQQTDRSTGTNPGTILEVVAVAGAPKQSPSWDLGDQSRDPQLMEKVFS